VTARSRQAHQLAADLSEHFGVPVTAVYYGERDRHGNGEWRLDWTDGPTVAAVVAETGHRAARYPALEVARLGSWRGHTDLAQAAALLAWLPQHPEQFDFLNTFTVDVAFDQTAFPERLDEQLQHRARALLRAGGGWLSGEAIRLLGEHCGRGWDQVEQWLDDNVVDLATARKRRQRP
jgi:hypothetical protein